MFASEVATFVAVAKNCMAESVLRIIESLRLVKTSKLIKSNLWPNTTWSMKSQHCVPWSAFLNTFRDADSAPPLSSTLQCLTAMWTVSVSMHSALWRGLRVFSLGRIRCSPEVSAWVGSIRNEVEEKLQVSVSHFGWLKSWIKKKNKN